MIFQELQTKYTIFIMNWKQDNNGIYVNTIETNDISYPEDGNNNSFQIEEKSKWFTHRNNFILNLIEKHPFSGDFLDIGGGNGFQSNEIRKNLKLNKTILCEPGYMGCLNAKKRGIEYIFNGFFEDFPFSDFQIGGIGLFDVIEHIENDIEFLNSIYNKIERETTLYITVPALKFLWSETDIISGHYRRFNKSDIERIQNNTPFQIIDTGYFFSYYTLPIFLLRSMPKKLGIKHKPNNSIRREQSYHTQNGKILNYLLENFHKKEIQKLKNGIKNNFGTSMYIVLKKQLNPLL